MKFAERGCIAWKFALCGSFNCSALSRISDKVTTFVNSIDTLCLSFHNRCRCTKLDIPEQLSHKWSFMLHTISWIADWQWSFCFEL